MRVSNCLKPGSGQVMHGDDVRAGPMNGAAEKTAIGTPRSSLRQRSARVPPTSVMGAENAIPSMARHTSRVSIFFATAQGMTKTHARKRVVALKG